MIYAPVVIPTLNRYEHFRQCLESLEQNVGADKTDVYIGLDYPPSEKYVEGWKAIDEYLRQKEKINEFKKLVVIRRDHNCGVMGKSCNLSLLITDVIKQYNRYILSEDDNIFSPNFLLYMNQALEEYNDDENCIAVCGYNYPQVHLRDYPYNIYLSHEYSAWGGGLWKDKKIYSDCLFSNYPHSIFSSWHNIWEIYKNEPRLLNTVLLNVHTKKVFDDTRRVCYQYLTKKYSVFPVLSKVRNLGFDGSGTTIFKVDDNFMKQEIDSNKDFVIDKIEGGVRPEVQTAVSAFFRRSVFMNAIILLRVVIYKLIGKDILYYEAKRRNRALFK